MAQVIKTLLEDCWSQALGLPRSPVQTDIRDLALGAFNEHATIIWLSWPFHNEKVDEFTCPAADSDGIITFDPTVESVRAITATTTSSEDTTRIWNKDDLIAAADGVLVGQDRFKHLADDSSGNRRIRVDADTAADSYKCLALKRWVDAVADDAYDANDPSATPNDYRVLTFILDRAEPALRANIKDALRIFQSIPPLRNGTALLALAVEREVIDNDTENRVNPRQPMFEELGELGNESY